MNIDHNSKEFFIGILLKRGFTNIIDTDSFDLMCYYDIEATSPKGKIWRFEIKRRNVSSTTYGDTIMEIYKLNNFIKDRKLYDYGCLVTLFTDKWTTSNVFKPIYEDVKMAALTTNFEKTDMVNKHFIHYSFNKEFEYEN